MNSHPLQTRADRGHDVPDRPPQHFGRQQRVPVGGRGALLGPEGPPHHAVRQLPAEEGAVERGDGEGVEADLQETGE